MKTIPLALLSSFALCASSALGTTLLTDDFSNGSRNNAPTGGDWYYVGTTTVTFPAGGGMNVAPGGGVSRTMQTTFSPATLAIGESLTASFDITLTDTPGNLDRQFRMGLFNSAGTSLTADNTTDNATTLASNADNYGYWSGVSTGSEKAAFMYYQPSGGSGFMSTSSTGAANLGSDFNFGGLEANKTYTFTLTLKRNSTSMDYTYAASGPLTGINPSGSVTRSYTGASTHSFDTFAILTNSQTLDYTINNVSIGIVPEPGTLGLLVIGSLAVFGLRRRPRPARPARSGCQGGFPAAQSRS